VAKLSLMTFFYHTSCYLFYDSNSMKVFFYYLCAGDPHLAESWDKKPAHASQRTPHGGCRASLLHRATDTRPFSQPGQTKVPPNCHYLALCQLMKLVGRGVCLDGSQYRGST
jgi:hypothetical protein